MHTLAAAFVLISPRIAMCVSFTPTSFFIFFIDIFFLFHISLNLKICLIDFSSQEIHVVSSFMLWSLYSHFFQDFLVAFWYHDDFPGLQCLCQVCCFWSVKLHSLVERHAQIISISFLFVRTVLHLLRFSFRTHFSWQHITFTRAGCSNDGTGPRTMCSDIACGLQTA